MLKLLLESVFRRPLTEAAPKPDDEALAALAERLRVTSRKRLGRSLAIRVVDAGSCNGCEMELNALSNAYYDVERFGIHFVASPRHADVLLVSGPVTKAMREALRRTHEAMPAPKWVISVGDCGFDGGCFFSSYAVVGGVGDVLDVDMHIPGCPPSPNDLLGGLVSLIEQMAQKRAS